MLDAPFDLDEGCSRTRTRLPERAEKGFIFALIAAAAALASAGTQAYSAKVGADLQKKALKQAQQATNSNVKLQQEQIDLQRQQLTDSEQQQQQAATAQAAPLLDPASKATLQTVAIAGGAGLLVIGGIVLIAKRG